jgi:ABC-2 type transport system permease protein
MIGTVIRIGLISLARDRVALGLTFVLPVVFFSIFAAAFSAMDAEEFRSSRAVLAVDPGTSFAARVADRLTADPGVEAERIPYDRRESAVERVRRGEIAAAVLLPPDLAPALARGDGETAAIELHVDRSNPLASGLVQGSLQAAAAAATIESLALPGADPDAAAVDVRVIDALGRTGKRPSIAFFGRGAILLEEREHGVLSRLLAARVGLFRLLLGRWLFLVALGTVQVAVMFVWAAVAFGLDLFRPARLLVFLTITAVTAAAAAAFGMALATVCRTRARLGGVSVVVILGLAALGGNLFPSFLMPEWLQALGRLTFNAWALEAYRHVFWYERGLAAVVPQLIGLAATAVACFAIAWTIARRWQRSGGLA